MKPVLAHFFCAHMPPHDALRSRVGGAVTPADAISPAACKGDQSDGQEFSDGILDAEAVLAGACDVWPHLASNQRCTFTELLGLQNHPPSQILREEPNMTQETTELTKSVEIRACWADKKSSLLHTTSTRSDTSTRTVSEGSRSPHHLIALGKMHVADYPSDEQIGISTTSAERQYGSHRTA